MLTDRKPVAWPGGKKLAVWVNVSVQHFPLNPQGKPVKMPGGMTMPYPDLRHYTLRDYGNRVGIYRILDALDRHDIKATMAVNACLCERYPQLVEAIVSRGDEVIGHSWSMDTPHAGGLDETAEAALIERSLSTLRTYTKQPVKGWLSPGKLETPQTPELLKANGIEYFCDWVNDDMPYQFLTANGELLAMPLSTELEDRLIIVENFQSESDWADQIIDACNFLRAEAEVSGGRILSIPIHPWVLGQPHRIKHLERALAHVMSTPDVWNATASDIAAAFTAAQR
jgi:peptidoglycan/xylan/chitin deacetylase (PgdA/CDA1 family)